MKHLYMITLGGKLPGGHSEIHDVQFVIAKDIEETYDVLRENWKGLDLKLHVDSYKALLGADGYEIKLSEKGLESSLKLFFVFAGGYDPKSMLEVHEAGLFVCESEDEAKIRVAKEMLQGMVQVHVDFVLDVSQATLLNKLQEGYIELVHTGKSYDQVPDWHGYHRIDTL